MFASGASVRSALEVLARSFDRGALSGEDAVAVVRDMGVVRKLADAVAGQAALQVEEKGAYYRCGDRSAAGTVAKAFGVERGEAHRIVETARKVSRLAATEAVVRAGGLSVREAELVADTVSAAPGSEPRMLSAARQGLRCLKDEAVRVRAEAEEPSERAARQRRGRSLSWWTDADGMVNGNIRLPAEVGGPIVGWFDEATRRVFRERSRGGVEERESHAAYAADVFVELVRRHAWQTSESGRGAEPDPGETPDDAPDRAPGDSPGREADGGSDREPGGRPDRGSGGGSTDGPGGGSLFDLIPDAAGTTVDLGFSYTAHVVIDHAALVRGECLGGERCEIPGVGPVSVAWARRVLGDAFLTAVVKKGVDITTVAHLGRHIPAELRTALFVSGRECDIESCGIRGYLEIDHDHEYAKGGAASWQNLGWLCSQHHRLKTSGWTLGPRDPTTRKRRLSAPDEARRRTHAA